MDGGKTWDKVLYADDSTGAIELALDPNNPRILFAALWHMQRPPWGFTAGNGSLWKSIDGGDTWKELSFNPGMPKNPLGRIGVSVSPANPQRIYANIECPPEDSTGGIFRSDDAGATWQLVSTDPDALQRGFYFSKVFADINTQCNRSGSRRGTIFVDEKLAFSRSIRRCRWVAADRTKKLHALNRLSFPRPWFLGHPQGVFTSFRKAAIAAVQATFACCAAAPDFS